MPLFMHVPPGIASRDKAGRELVCKLKRTLYGLRQAGRAWASLFASFLVSMGVSSDLPSTCASSPMAAS